MKKLLFYSGLVVLILFMLAFTVGLWLKLSTGARVAQQRAAISAAGDRLYLTEYAREPIPDEENAFYFLMLAKADLEAFDDESSKLSEYELTRRLRPDQVEELAQLVEKHEQFHQTYVLLAQAADCAQYDSQADYSQGLALDLPDIQLLREAGRALQAKALVQAYRGDGDGALAACEQSLRINALLQNEPLIISHLVSLACQSVSVLSANHVLRVADTSPAARERLDATLAAFDNRRASVAAIKGERAWGALTFEQLRMGKIDPQSLDAPTAFGLLSSNWFGQAYLNDDEAEYLELMEKYIQAAEMDANARQRVVAPIDDKLRAGGVRHVLSRLLLPALVSSMNASDRGDTLNHALRVLLALEGRDNAQLVELGLPAAATVDGGGVPLFIKKSEQGWLVYGVGENGVDEGGKFDWSTGELLDVGLAPLDEPLTPTTDETK